MTDLLAKSDVFELKSANVQHTKNPNFVLQEFGIRKSPEVWLSSFQSYVLFSEKKKETGVFCQGTRRPLAVRDAEGSVLGTSMNDFELYLLITLT